MKLFVDTSAWIALHDKCDQNHQKAVMKSEDIKKKRIQLITSEYVFDEAVTLIRHRMSHHAAVVFGDSLLNSSIVAIVDIAGDVRRKAWDLFKTFSDKEFSFTDCTSFVLMEKLKIERAFAFDRHFTQAGKQVF
jgi:uncharacterized protein